MEIKIIETHEISTALELVLQTFMIYEAPDYSKEGVESFKKSIFDKNYLNNILFYGAYETDMLRGVIATRKHGNHIAMFFVDGKFHRQGIGKKLFNVVLENSSSDIITVNSSPYAVEIYRRLGFTETAQEQTTDGIRYTPMSYTKQ